MIELHVGDHVADREDDDAMLLVIGTTTATADEYEAGGRTIADYNPDWPADDPVVECAYPQRTDVDVKGLKTYVFPRSRLRLVAAVHDRDEEGGELMPVDRSDTITIRWESSTGPMRLEFEPRSDADGWLRVTLMWNGCGWRELGCEIVENVEVEKPAAACETGP